MPPESEVALMEGMPFGIPSCCPNSTRPDQLALPTFNRLGAEIKTRRLSLNEEVSEFGDCPIADLLGTMDGDDAKPVGIATSSSMRTTR